MYCFHRNQQKLWISLNSASQSNITLGFIAMRIQFEHSQIFRFVSPGYRKSKKSKPKSQLQNQTSLFAVYSIDNETSQVHFNLYNAKLQKLYDDILHVYPFMNVFQFSIGLYIMSWEMFERAVCQCSIIVTCTTVILEQNLSFVTVCVQVHAVNQIL